MFQGGGFQGKKGMELYRGNKCMHCRKRLKLELLVGGCVVETGDGI